MAFFKSSSLKLTHINRRSVKSKKMEISIFPKEDNISILTLNETWLKSKFKLDIPNYTITHNDKSRRQGEEVAFIERNNINFGIADTCSSIDTGNKPITIILKDSQYSTNISTIYISPASIIKTTLLNNINNSTDNIIITGDHSWKSHTVFNCSKMDKWGIGLKQSLYDADLFIVENSIPTHRESRTNTIDIIDYLISSWAIYSNIQNFSLK